MVALSLKWLKSQVSTSLHSLYRGYTFVQSPWHISAPLKKNISVCFSTSVYQVNSKPQKAIWIFTAFLIWPINNNICMFACLIIYRYLKPSVGALTLGHLGQFYNPHVDKRTHCHFYNIDHRQTDLECIYRSINYLWIHTVIQIFAITNI